MYCNYCGAANPDAASFCSRCGKAIDRPAAPVQPATVQATAAQSTTVRPVSAQSTAEKLIAGVLNSDPAAQPIVPAAAVPAAPAAFAGTLTPAARTDFVAAYTKEVGRQIDDKTIPAGIAAWIITLIAVYRFSPVFALVLAFVAAGTVSAIVKAVLREKWVRPIADMSDEMLVARYNEAKADRRAARTRIAIGWAVVAIIAVILVVAWVAAHG